MISLGDWGIWKTNLTFWKKTPLVLSSQILSVSIPFPWLCKNQLSFLQKVKLIIHFKEISIWVWGVGEDFGSTVRELENSVLMNTILSVYAWQSHFFTVAFSHIFTASFFLFFLSFSIFNSTKHSHYFTNDQWSVQFCNSCFSWSNFNLMWVWNEIRPLSVFAASL